MTVKLRLFNGQILIYIAQLVLIQLKIINMSKSILQSTLQHLEKGFNVEDMLRSFQQQIHPHILEAIKFKPIEILNKFHQVTKQYQFRCHRNDRIGWKKGQKKLFQFMLLAFSYVNQKKISSYTYNDWISFSKEFSFKNVLLLKYQAKNILISQTRVSWTHLQKQILDFCIKGHLNYRWAEISRYLFFQTNGQYYKTPKQCREHWQNHLLTDVVRGRWEKEQDLTILKIVSEAGRKWSKVKANLPKRRTEHMIKNRFNSLLTSAKRILMDRHSKIPESELIEFLIQKINNSDDVEASQQESFEQSQQYLEQQQHKKGRIQQNLLCLNIKAEQFDDEQKLRNSLLQKKHPKIEEPSIMINQKCHNRSHIKINQEGIATTQQINSGLQLLPISQNFFQTYQCPSNIHYFNTVMFPFIYYYFV